MLKELIVNLSFYYRKDKNKRFNQVGPSYCREILARRIRQDKTFISSIPKITESAMEMNFAVPSYVKNRETLDGVSLGDKALKNLRILLSSKEEQKKLAKLFDIYLAPLALYLFGPGEFRADKPVLYKKKTGFFVATERTRNWNAFEDAPSAPATSLSISYQRLKGAWLAKPQLFSLFLGVYRNVLELYVQGDRDKSLKRAAKLNWSKLVSSCSKKDSLTAEDQKKLLEYLKEMGADFSGKWVSDTRPLNKHTASVLDILKREISKASDWNTVGYALPEGFFEWIESNVNADVEGRELKRLEKAVNFGYHYFEELRLDHYH